MPDRSGNNYTKTAKGGKARMVAAARYMDERENTQLYTVNERGEIVETDRYEAQNRIEDTQTRYQQHQAFTTTLDANSTLVDEQSAAKHVIGAIRERRPDADIYAASVHRDTEGGERKVHVHVAYGTDTTLRRDDLKHFREQAYSLEQRLERDNLRELSPAEQQISREMGAERAAGQEMSREATPAPRGLEMEAGGL